MVSSLYSKIKYRWKMAPMWIKCIDIVCWLGLILIIVLW